MDEALRNKRLRVRWKAIAGTRGGAGLRRRCRPPPGAVRGDGLPRRDGRGQVRPGRPGWGEIMTDIIRKTAQLWLPAALTAAVVGIGIAVATW